jgi:hypothetical protein
MRASSGVLIIVVALALTGLADIGAQEYDNAPHRVAVELKDGSRILGTSEADQSVNVVNASMVQAGIRLREIESIDFDQERGALKVVYRSGEGFEGSPGDTPFHLDTLLGRLTVPMDSIARLRNLGTTGLAAHSRFDGDATEETGSGNDAVLHGGAAYEEGVRGEAVSLDGVDDYVEIPSSGLLNLEHTVAFWVKVDEPRDASFVSKAILGNGYGIWLGRDGNFNQGTAGSNRVSFGFDGRGIHWNWHMITGSTEILPGKWHHIAATVGPSGQVLYVDGREVALDPTPDTPYLDTAIWLGREMRLRGGHMKGLIDDVQIYGRALSAEEVRILYEAGKAGGG